jgi:hypothetical protein
MAYILRKDLGGLAKGTVLTFLKGVYTADGAVFDPLDVITDSEHFEEIGETCVGADVGEYKLL